MAACSKSMELVGDVQDPKRGLNDLAVVGHCCHTLFFLLVQNLQIASPTEIRASERVECVNPK